MLGLVLVTEALTVYLLTRTLGADLLAALDARLVRQATAAVQWLDRSQHPDRLAPRLGALLDVDVAIIGSDGVVKGQSEGERATSVEALLPEIQVARGGGIGRDMRWSASRQTEMRYLAVGTLGGVVIRLGVPTASVRASLRETRGRVLLGAGVALLLALVLGAFGAGLVARPLRAMAEAARGIAAGRRDVILPPETPDDVGRLSHALAEMKHDLEARMDALRAEEAGRREFLADASHELRTPLATVMATAERLAGQGSLAPEAAEALATIRRHAERMSRLVGDLLKLSSLEGPAHGNLELAAVPLAPIVAHVASALRTRAAGRLTVDVPADVIVRADEAALEQVIENLVDNALKYAGDAAVRVRASAVAGDDVRVAIVVEDDGPGIPAEHLPHVFERFYRVDASRSRALGGSGLGLAIVRRLVELMGGTIAVESPAGARFTITLARAV